MLNPLNKFLTHTIKALGVLFLFLCVAFSSSPSAMAQAYEISGRVLDGETNLPIPGANVVEVGTQNGTITDIDGDFTLTVSGSDAQLRFSYVGYESQTIDINGRGEITVMLSPSLAQLEDVVVTAFGMERERKALGYSVTQVDGAELAQAREVNLGDALQGRVSGVNVSNIGSGVGGSSRVIIRGNVSLSGNNEPLYVIDGVPMDNSQLGSAGTWGGSDWGDGLSSINPDDIADISVLKGASAAALYGSRASNGVVLITTKSGESARGQDGIGVEFNTNFTAEQFINTYDFQSQYGHGTRGEAPQTEAQGLEYGGSAWGGKLDGSNVYQFDGEQRPYVAHEDNHSEFYQTGFNNTNTIAVTGGTSNQLFRLSIADLRNEAIVPNSGMNRQTIVLSSNGEWADRLRINTKVQYTREDVQNRARLSDSPGNANYTLSVLPPSIDVSSLKGSTEKMGAQPDGTEMLYGNNVYSQNPYWATHQFKNNNVRDRFLGSGTFRFEFTDWLYGQARVGMDWYTNRRTSLEPYGTGYNPDGALTEIEQRVRETNLEYVVGFAQGFKDFDVRGLLGGSYMRRSFEDLSARSSNFNIPFLHTLGNGANQSIGYGLSESGINSLFGSAEVSWKDLVYLTVTGRNDWFSTLPKNSNSILYPSVSTSFVFSDAFDLPDVITFGKLRASWAQVGGGTDPYQLALNYSLVGQGHQGAALGRINQGSVPNNQLQPLTLEEYEIGFDVRLFDNRVGFDYAFYSKKTSNDILQAAISSSSGFGSATVNVGEVSNTGHEFLLTVNPVQNINFNWDVLLNFSYNENDVEQLYKDSKVLQVQEARNRDAKSQHRIAYTDADGEYFEGGYSMIVGRAHKLINGEKVYDKDGLPVYDSKQRVLGSGIHPWTGGVQNNFQYKGFNFGFLVDFKFGGDLYTGTNATTYRNGMHKATLEGREDGLTISGVDENGNSQTWNILPNTPANKDEVTVQDYYSRLGEITEYFVEDASFVKLRSLTIGYQIPFSFLEGLPINGASVSLVGRNLLLIYSKVDNVDPESTYNTSNGQGLEFFGAPQTRSVGLNLNLKF